MSGTQAFNWFTDVAKFRQLCGDALSQAKGERAEEFTHDMMRKANEFGLNTDLSYKQLKWLCTIAEWEVPPEMHDIDNWPWPPVGM